MVQFARDLFVIPHQETGVNTVKHRSQAELQEVELIHVTLKAHDWVNRATCSFRIMNGEIPILTDHGYVLLDMDRIPINFGSTDGHMSNAEYLTKVVKAAADAYIRPFAFVVEVIERSGHVRFKLRSREGNVKHLEVSSHFETSVASFDRAFPHVQEKESVAA